MAPDEIAEVQQADCARVECRATHRCARSMLCFIGPLMLS
jgi:hypothetical protein